MSKIFVIFLIMALLFCAVFILHKQTSGGKGKIEPKTKMNVELYYNLDNGEMLYKPLEKYEEPFRRVVNGS